MEIETDIDNYALPQLITLSEGNYITCLFIIAKNIYTVILIIRIKRICSRFETRLSKNGQNQFNSELFHVVYPPTTMNL